MKNLRSLEKNELEELLRGYKQRLNELKALNLKLDLSRGKPDKNQLDLGVNILDAVNAQSDFSSENGMDTRNYGALEGIPEARRLMGEMLGVKEENVLVGGNSSLNLMYDSLMRAMVFGVAGCTPMLRQEKRKFLCPAPGYDRHFLITQDLGFELIPVTMTEDGPDMDEVERLVRDETIKGIWCVPQYANPTGCVYSDETVKRFARLSPAAKDFRIYWDNAYCVHFLYRKQHKPLLNILQECEKAGNPDLVYEFTSTSKISFAGGGISCMASSVANIKDAVKHMKFQTIGHDKVNQLRHVRYFKNLDGIMAHMEKQANLLRPKFETVLRMFDEAFEGEEICSYTRPLGGYFISFQAMNGCAKAIVEACKQAGVTLTSAGATYPYGIDPNDSNIRIAPTFATEENIATAVEIFCICTHIVSIEKLLHE